MDRLINIGFGNMMNISKVTVIVNPDSAPGKRLMQNAREAGTLIDATQGRRTRAVIVTDDQHIVLSALQPETIANRFQGGQTQEIYENKEG